MKALYFSKHGGVEELRYGDIDEPKLKPGCVIVQVKACALNHLDLWVLRGWPGLKLNFPHVGGADIAGVLHDPGSETTAFKIGASVLVSPGIILGKDEWTERGEPSVSPNYRIIGEQTRGGFAEFVSVPAENLFPLPEKLDSVEASSFPLVATTAWRMLVVRAELSAGQTVLIVGAGGGVNSFAIQLAHTLGAKVFALTSSAEKMKKAESLGAEVVLNYRDTPDWGKEIIRLTRGRGVDIVVDNVGKATMPQSLIAVRRGGKIVTVGNTSGESLSIDNRYIFTKQVSVLGSTMGSREDFQQAMKLVLQGKIKPVIDQVIPLSKGRMGYERMEHGNQFGKIVLTP